MEIYIPWFEPSTHLCLGVREIMVFRRSSGAHAYLIIRSHCREASRGRLGLVNLPKKAVGDAPWPLPLRIGVPGVRIVNLSAAGMYVHLRSLERLS